MAKRKQAASQEPFAPIPTANIPRDPATLQKIGEGVLDAFAEHEQATAAQEAKRAIAQAGKRPKHPRRDIAAVNSRLHDVALNLIAIHDLCNSAMDLCGAGEAESILLLIRESARSSARAVDACTQRLGETVAMGCFADDLETH
jgi:hypothetical protein